MKKFTLYSLFVGIMLSGQLFGQKEKLIDSLERMLPGLHDSARVQALCDLAYKYRTVDPQKSYLLLHESIQLAQELNRPAVIQQAYTAAVRIHYKNGSIDSSLIYSHRFYDFLIDLKDSMEIAQAANNLGVLYKITGDYVKALDYYKKSLDIKIKMGNQLGIAKSLNNLGLVYDQLGSYEKALGYYLQSLKIKRELGDKSSLAASLINIGNIYEKLQMDSLSLASQNEALHLYQQENILKGKATAYNNLGELLHKQGEIDEAFAYFQKALALNDSIKNISGLAYSYNNLGSILSEKGKTTEALAMHKRAIEQASALGDRYALASFNLDLGNTYLSISKTQLAGQYLETSLRIAQNEKLLALKYQAILSLSKLKYQQGKYYSAFGLQERGHAIKDSIFNEESKRAIANLRIIHEVDEQQKRIELLNETNHIQQQKLKQTKYLTWSLAINLLAFLVFIVVGIVRFRKLSKLNKQLKLQQSELKKQNEFLNTLIDTIPSPILYKDKNLKVLGCNSLFEKMLGAPAEILIGSTLDQYENRSKLDVHYLQDKLALDEPGIFMYESKIIFTDQKEHDVIVYKSRFKNENNEVAGVLAIILDISERKRDEMEIRQNEKRLAILNDLHKDFDDPYEELVRKSHQIICEYTAAAYSFYLKWPADKPIQSELVLFNCKNKKIETSKIDNHHLDGNPDFEKIKNERQTLHIAKEDTRIQDYGKLLDIPPDRLHELLLFPIIEGDSGVGIAGIANFNNDLYPVKQANISLFISEIWGLLQRKKILADIQQSEIKLKESNAAKDKFFSIIAHDLKNPFNAILGFAQLLSDYYNEFDENEKLQYIQNLREASEATYRLLENLLQWSFAQTGKIEFKPEEIDLSVFANESAVFAKPSCDKKNLRIHIQIPFNSTVFADANMVQAIFRNLLSNAIKFSNRGQTIKLEISNTQKMRTVHVIDNGVGIAPENVKRLFKVGEKVKSNGTEEEKGTGLGLLLCKEFIEMNGGELQVKSQPGKGSTFSFSLPCSQ